MRRLKFVHCGGTGLGAEGTGRCIDCHMPRIDVLFDRNTSIGTQGPRTLLLGARDPIWANSLFAQIKSAKSLSVLTLASANVYIDGLLPENPSSWRRRLSRGAREGDFLRAHSNMGKSAILSS